MKPDFHQTKRSVYKNGILYLTRIKGVFQMKNKHGNLFFFLNRYLTLFFLELVDNDLFKILLAINQEKKTDVRITLELIKVIKRISNQNHHYYLLQRGGKDHQRK